MRSPGKNGCCSGRCRNVKKTVLQQRFIATDPPLEESFGSVKNCLSDPAKQAKL
jgi:hypothetical protein